MLVHREHCMVPQASADVGHPWLVSLNFSCTGKRLENFNLSPFGGWKLNGVEGDLCSSARAVPQPSAVWCVLFPVLLDKEFISIGKGCKRVTRSWACDKVVNYGILSFLLLYFLFWEIAKFTGSQPSKYLLDWTERNTSYVRRFSRHWMKELMYC